MGDLATKEQAEGRLVMLWQDQRDKQSAYYLISPEVISPEAQPRSKPALEAIISWITAQIEADA